MITAIYLAAGKSSRMGENKLSLAFGNETVGNTALSVLLTAPFIDYVFVIVKPTDPVNWISIENKRSLNGEKGEIIRCKDANRGQSFSLKKGFEVAVEKQADKILVCLADQPFITEDMIRKIVNTPIHSSEEFAASMYNGVLMPPILFLPSVYSKIKLLEGDMGARKIINNGKIQGGKIEFSEELFFIDIDTKIDYYNALVRRK